MKRFLVFLLLILLTSSCAGYRPIVDLRGQDETRYEMDLKDCQAYADQISPGGEAVAGGIIGGAIGGLLGFAVGVALGNPGEYIGFGAAIGGAQGVAGGAAGGARGQVDIIRNCLAGRGYRILR